MSFNMSPGIGPRQAIGKFGQTAKDGRFFDRRGRDGYARICSPL